jgi:transposase
LETRHVRNAFKINAGKDGPEGRTGHCRTDATGVVSPGPLQVEEAQETRAMVTAQLVQKSLHELEMSLRSVLRGFGLKIGKVVPTQSEARIPELVEGHPSLKVIATSTLAVRATLRRESNGFGKRLRAMACGDMRARLLMSVPGVGTIVALTYATAIDGPERFTSSETVGARLDADTISVGGNRPRRSDLRDRRLLGACDALRERPHHHHRAVKGCTALKSWAMRIAKRAGTKKATVALARAHRHHASNAPRLNDVHDPASVALCSVRTNSPKTAVTGWCATGICPSARS